jgi:hypothetical protein
MKPRNIVDVINTIKPYVPVDREQLLLGLEWIINDTYYRAPEDVGLSWEILAENLFDEIGEIPIEDWHFKVLSIFSTVPEEEIREEVAKRN